ncbi:MAG: sortase, partial [Oscillospiraceae bacterium]
LSIPKLNLELPVLDECTDYLLKLSVCRYEGKTEGTPSKLIIAGHNYKSHFKTLSELAVGDTVTFTSLTGEVYSYTVSALEEIDGNDIDGLHQGDWDITLFTCNFDGGNRLLIRCRLI